MSTLPALLDPAAQAIHQAAQQPTQRATTARFDIYAGIHKALRTLMGDILGRLGRCDLDHPGDLRDTLERTDLMLDLMASHVDSENTVIHTAIEARLPQGARQTTEDHVEHQHSIAALRQDVQVLRVAQPVQRPLLARHLYRQMALFVAENLEHMHVEETTNNATLWSLFTDAEIGQLEGQIVGRLSPEKMMAYMRWFAVGLSTAELTGLLQAMRLGAPAEAFDATLALIKGELSPERWDRLATALQMGSLVPASTATH
jgi:hypothetical protein